MGVSLLIAVIAGERVRPILMIVSAVTIAYVVGLVLFPMWWLFERAGWRGWRCYAPTAAVAGFWVSYLGLGGPDAAWQTHAVCIISGTACAMIFSLVLSAAPRSAS